MKHLIILLTCLSATPLWAQRSIKIVPPSTCPMTLYNRRLPNPDTPIMSSSIKARGVETIIVKYDCESALSDQLYAGATLFLVIRTIDGQELTNNLPAISLNGKSTQPYAQGVFSSDKGIAFAVRPPNEYWRKGESYIFEICNKDGRIAKKILLMN